MLRAVAGLTLLLAAPADALSLTSPAFPPGGSVPPRFTCDGRDVSPPLQFSHVPRRTNTLALVVVDPDAPGGHFTHWVLYEIPPGTLGLSEAGDSQLPAGTRAGTNDFGRTRWGGPCPPDGRHRYVFRLYALDTALGDLHAPTRAALESAMAGHVLEESELTATYERQKPAK